MTTGDEASPAGGLEALLRSIGADGPRRGPAPVDRWNPPFCGDLDLRIASDGTWHYMGTPIGRPALVRLFASVLKREGEHHFLVTPVEKVGIRVEDAPFLAVELAVDGAEDDRVLSFRTNVDDVVSAGPDHPLTFAPDPAGGLKPYIDVRRGLLALATRPVFYELVELGEVRDVGGAPMFGIASGGAFFPMAPADQVEAWS